MTSLGRSYLMMVRFSYYVVYIFMYNLKHENILHGPFPVSEELITSANIIISNTNFIRESQDYVYFKRKYNGTR